MKDSAPTLRTYPTGHGWMVGWQSWRWFPSPSEGWEDFYDDVCGPFPEEADAKAELERMKA